MHNQNRSPVIEHANKCHPNVSLLVWNWKIEEKKDGEKALDTIECQRGDKDKLEIVLHVSTEVATMITN